MLIDAWFMRCRVLIRGMEHFTLITLVHTAKEKGFKYIKGEYIPTAKNNMVKNHYKNLYKVINNKYPHFSVRYVNDMIPFIVST